MWPKESPESPMDSSGYVSNSNSMNAPPVKYATVGRRVPGSVKRTSSMFVTQPHPPGVRPNPIPKPKRSFATKDTLRVYKNDLSRPSSRASKSSANSGSGLGGRRPASRERHGPPMMRRGGARASHSKIRRPDSRASSKAKILRRQESKRRVRSATSGRSSSAAASGGSSRPTSRTSQGQGPSPSNKKPEPKQSFFSLWKPRLGLKRSKSLHVKEKVDTRREIRFGDAEQPGVVMMRGVQHRRAESPARPTPPGQRRPPLIKVQDYGKMDASMSQTLPRPPRQPDGHMRGVRASSVDIVEARERDRSVPPPAPLRGPPGSPQWRPESPQRPPPGSPQRQRPPGSPQRRSREREPERRKSPLRPSRSVSPAKQRPPSELSSSPAPRAPIWRASSDGSLSETITQLSAISVSRYPGRPAARPSKPRPRNSAARPADKPAGDKPSVMDMIRRKFSMKPKDKASGPTAPGVGNAKRREGVPSSSASPQGRLGQRERLRAARSHDMLADDKPYPPSQPDKKSFSSLPRGKHRSGGTTLTRKLSNMSWGTLGRAQAERQRNNMPPKDRGYPPSKGSRHDVSDPQYRPTDIEPPPRPSPERQRSLLRDRPIESPDLDEEPMIQPIIQERRALSQPSLYFPANAEPDNSEEPFTVYANLPFKLPARRSPSPTRPGLSAAKRAMSQPSLLDPPNQRPLSPVSSGEDRSDTIYAYSPHQMAPPPPGAQRQLTTRTVWKPTITVKRRGILKRRQSAEEKQAAARRVEGAPPGQNVPQTKQQGMLHGIAHNIRSVFKHRKGAGNDDAVPEGYVAVPGGAVVSERFTNITNTHEQKDDVREEEEVHHLGDYTNEEVTRAVRDGADARALVRARASSSDHAGQLVDPRNGQRRLIHQSGKTWRTVDTEDIHEKSHQDDKGELITETARTKQREEFSNVLVPDDGEELPESGVREAARSSSHHRRHTKDVDMLEYYSVPRGGRIGDGIKLGEGLRYVQENVEEDREGDDNIESLSERMRQLRQLGYKPEGQVLAKTPIEYQEEEKTKRQVTNKWLESHFAKGDSGSSEDGEPRRTRLGIENRRQGTDEVDHRRETNTYQYQKSSGTTQTGTAPPKTWSKSEKYSKNVRETPEHTYVTESRQGPRGGFDRVQVLPAPVGSSKATDLQSEADEDPIFNSKFSTGKPRRGGAVRFQSEVERPRWEESGRLSPPTQSPPPPPPPRHRKKGRDTQSPPDGANNNHYASSPIRERYQRELSPGQTREYHRQIEDSYQSSPSRQRRRDDYDDDRRDSHGRREERHAREIHFGSAERSSREAHQVSRGGGQPPQRREDGTSSDEQRRRLVSSGDQQRMARHQQLESRHHRSVDHLDDRRLDGDRSQTLPRRPQQYPPSPVQRVPDTSRFGGSLINVSSKQPRGVGPAAPQKPARSPVQRSNSMYDREGNGANEAFSVGLKSPDIISKMQRGTLRRGDDSDRYRADERESQTSSSTLSYPRSPTGRPRPPPGSIPPSSGDTKKDSFMHGLRKAAPDLYNVLHGDGGKTPSPKQSPPMTPPPPLQRAQSPGQRHSSGQRPGVRRVERLRGDDDDDGHSRSRSYTPPDETSYRPSPRPNVVKVQR